MSRRGRERRCATPDAESGPVWSRDGRFLLAQETGDLYLLPLAGAIRMINLASTPELDQGPHLSPDGSLLAYRSTSPPEVYVRSFQYPPSGMPILGSATKVTSNGGVVSPRWRNDGRGLYYLAADGGMVAVPITPMPFEAGTPTKLFQAPGNLSLTVAMGTSVEMSGDGQRFAFLVSSK